MGIGLTSKINCPRCHFPKGLTDCGIIKFGKDLEMKNYYLVLKRVPVEMSDVESSGVETVCTRNRHGRESGKRRISFWRLLCHISIGKMPANWNRIEGV